MNILFDIDNTLFPTSEFAALARKNALNAMISMGLTLSFDKLHSMLTEIIIQKGSNYPHHFNDLCKELGLNPNQSSKYIAAAVAAYHDTKASIATFPQVPLALLELKKLGHQLYIATHGNAVKQWDKLIRLKIALYFDDVFVSEDLGGEKNDFFYRKILEKLKVPAQNCMMVGDREETDILPAKKLSITTVKIIPKDHLILKDPDKFESEKLIKNAKTNTKANTKADFTIHSVDEIIGIVKHLRT